MYCRCCHKDIEVGGTYFKDDCDRCFCSVDCVTDFMIYNCRLSIETNDGETDEEDED